MSEKIFDLAIIGGGPAGLTAAQYGARAALSVLVIEGAMGGQALQISELENYPGIFPHISGWEFSDKMKAQAKEFGAVFKTGMVVSLTKQGSVFSLKCPDADFCARAVILATGCKPQHLGIPGEAEFAGRGVSYCATCDGPFFRNKRVCVIGGGDSAFEEARFLSNIAQEVILIHRRHEFRAQKAIVQRVAENPKIKIKAGFQPLEIRGDATVSSILLKNVDTGAEEVLETNGIFIFAGLNANTEIFTAIRTDERGFIITDENMATSIDGLFCAGDVRAKPFRQVVTACSDGAIAAHSAERFLEES